MPKWDYKVLDHRWNNFKRWFEAMEERKDTHPIVSMDALRRMIDCCDKMADTEENLVLDALMGEDWCKNNPKIDPQSEKYKSHLGK